MLKKLSFPFLLLLVLAGAVFWFMQEPSAPDRNDREENTTAGIGNRASDALSANGSLPEDLDPQALGLLLKTIQLSQGEKGAELWRLNADAASMTRQEGRIFVTDPRLVYIMPPDNKELHVVSLRGDIDQEAQILRFIENVHATYTNSTMTGDLLVYNGTARSMSFPQGGRFEDEQAFGTADVVTWHLDTRVIEGRGNVDVTFSSDKNLPGVKAPGTADGGVLPDNGTSNGTAE